MVQDVLVWAGYEVLVADHPERVMAQSENRHPDLFLIDMMLPMMSGIELVQHLRGQGHASTPMPGMCASRFMCQMATSTGVFTAIIDKLFELRSLQSLL
jgi:CheY-like chemotaxis protein